MKWVAFEKSELTTLIQLLRERGYRVLGPLARDGAIVYDDLPSADHLPTGLRDEQQPGRYRLVEGEPGRRFDYTVAAQSWKRFVHPPRRTLLTIKREGLEMEVPPPPEPMAFLGVRACELAALKVLSQALPLDSRPFVVAVECMRAGEMCFCASMGAGPEVGPGYDLALDELDGAFLARAGTSRGQEVLDALGPRPAREAEVQQAQKAVAQTAAQMKKRLDTENIRDLLLGNLEHPRWDEVATRCLGCANCTMVCPTCFCSTVEDHTDLEGDTAERVQLWDSCFNLDFTYTNGYPVRQSLASRYRQWLTHKLASWHDQFGTSGCVGCGRCITWCPVGIDLTEEVEAIRNA